jgi:hypothetical protein
MRDTTRRVETPRDRELRERRVLMRVRAERVERLALPACRICGGATSSPEDCSLRCDCAEKVAHLNARVHRILHDHTVDDRFDLGARIAP